MHRLWDLSAEAWLQTDGLASGLSPPCPHISHHPGSVLQIGPQASVRTVTTEIQSPRHPRAQALWAPLLMGPTQSLPVASRDTHDEIQPPHPSTQHSQPLLPSQLPVSHPLMPFQAHWPPTHRTQPYPRAFAHAAPWAAMFPGTHTAPSPLPAGLCSNLL